MREEVADTVASAFTAARAGSYAEVSALADVGSGVIPYLMPYVTDTDEMVRTQAVALLSTFADPETVPMLASALTDEQQDIRARAASALYEKQDPLYLADQPELEEALAESLQLGNDSAAAILLAGYFPTEPMVEALRELNERSPDAFTELWAWSPPVRVALCVSVSLSRIGDRQARLHLLQVASTGTADEREFLLSVLRDVDAPEVLHALASALDDTSSVGGGVPSGASPHRRLCDLAVEAFVQRLNLQVDFAIKPHGQYAPEEISRVRDAILGQIPRG